MSYYNVSGSASCFVKFGGQMSRNVHDIWKVCFETTFYVYACFIEIYVFILDEIYVGCPSLVYKTNRDGNVWLKVPKDELSNLMIYPWVLASKVL